MASQADYRELIRKQFTKTKLLFHILFWAFHWGIFAYGWYALASSAAAIQQTLILP